MTLAVGLLTHGSFIDIISCPVGGTQDRLIGLFVEWEGSDYQKVATCLVFSNFHLSDE